MKSLLRKWLAPGKRGAEAGFDLCLDGNRGARKVMIFTERTDATYFISFDLPMRRMHSRGEVNLAVASAHRAAEAGAGCWERWADAFPPDVVVMTRYALPFGPEIAAWFQRRGTPVIYHIDDDLLEVPDHLGAELRQRHANEPVVQARLELLRRCDLIYASTSHLADLLRARFPGHRVYHGIYAPYLGDEIGVRPAERADPTIGYMGSLGHQQDLALAVPALERLLEERPRLRFEVFGTVRMPASLERFGARVRTHAARKSYLEFVGTLARLGWQVGLAPLAHAPFNLSKAPTKFVEYAACGIPVVASDVPVYSEVIPAGGGVLVKSDDWREAIGRLLDQPDLRQQARVRAQDYCRQAFSMGALQAQLNRVFDMVQTTSDIPRIAKPGDMTAEEIQTRLQTLSPQAPWAHLFEFAPGVFSVTPANAQFYRKATGLRQVGELLLQMALAQLPGHSLQGKRVLDLACGEGGHAIRFAQCGAQVLGVEGRPLYVERARFAAAAMGQPQVEFVLGDVRKLDPGLGTFDLVIFSGILHHLGVESFDAMIDELGRLTRELLLVYTHVSSDLAVRNHRLKGPVRTPRGREGYLFREHEDNATAKERVEQVRASLDNTFSFWAREEVLIEALQAAGFPLILKVMAPHVFDWAGASYRPILAARKRSPTAAGTREA